MDQTPIALPPVVSPVPTPSAPKSRKALWIGGAGVLVLVVLAGAYFFVQSKGSSADLGVATATPGVTDTQILLGSSAALSGNAADLGLNLLSGSKVAVEQINAAGGINGRQLKIVSYDDAYDPPQAIVNTQKLINQDKVFALFSYVGTPTGVAVLPIVAEAKIPLVGMF